MIFRIYPNGINPLFLKRNSKFRCWNCMAFITAIFSIIIFCDISIYRTSYRNKTDFYLNRLPFFNLNLSFFIATKLIVYH